MESKKGIHDGHRKRLRKKFLENGLDNFEDHQVLELLLFYAIPRKDTNEIAHRLIDSCGSISAVFDSPVEVLQECGISENAAVLLKIMPDLCRKYINDKYRNEFKNITEENVADRIVPKFIGLEEENVLLMLLDAKGKEIFCGIISKGSVNASEIYTRKIIQLAIKFHASGAIIAHNHPSGIALPSKEDLKSTVSLKMALDTVGIKLLDHIIVADMNYLSLAQSEEYFEIFM